MNILPTPDGTTDPAFSHRPVQAGDLERLCEFAETPDELFYFYPKATFPLDLAHLKRAIAERTDSTVALYNGDLAGFANFYRWDPKGVCAIGNVMVAPEHRRKGVGRYVIETMIDLARTKHQAREVHVSCFIDNTGGLALYKKLGFEETGRERRFTKSGATTTLINFSRKP